MRHGVCFVRHVLTKATRDRVTALAAASRTNFAPFAVEDDNLAVLVPVLAVRSGLYSSLVFLGSPLLARNCLRGASRLLDSS